MNFLKPTLVQPEKHWNKQNVFFAKSLSLDSLNMSKVLDI